MTMAHEYTPTTSDIRVAWISINIDATDESPMPMTKWDREFDRWLTEVRATAWQEGNDLREGSDNPYRHA